MRRLEDSKTTGLIRLKTCHTETERMESQVAMVDLETAAAASEGES